MIDVVMPVEDAADVLKILPNKEYRITFKVDAKQDDVDKYVQQFKRHGYSVMIQSSAFSPVEIVVTGKVSNENNRSARTAT